MKKEYKALLYTTKQKPRLVYRQWTSTLDQIGIDNSFEGFLCGSEKNVGINELGVCEQLNGKIVAECDYEVEEIEYSLIVANNKPYHYYEPQNTFVDKFYEKSCLNHQQVEEYLGHKIGKAVHIKNLHMFDEPKELSEYYGLIPKKINDFNGSCYVNVSIDNAPKNMMYAIDDNDKEYIIISVSPQEMCRIANKEQTVLVRKKVLKEMI